MFEHILHCAVIVTDGDIKYQKAINANVGEAKGSLEWSFNLMHAVIMMLRKIEEKNQKNMNAQRTSS